MYGGDSMKLVTYLDGQLRVGAVVGSRVVDLSERFDSVPALIEEGEPALGEARELAEKADPLAEVGEVELRAPIPHPRRNVFCMGWNYLTHFEEGRGRRGDQEEELPEYPTFFDKPTTTVIGPYDDIPFDPHFSEKMDYEGAYRPQRPWTTSSATRSPTTLRPGTSSGATAASGSKARGWTEVARWDPGSSRPMR
jgi:hypothetical protein